jgi:hypothetical protein
MVQLESPLRPVAAQAAIQVAAAALRPLAVAQLYRAADLSALAFVSIADIEPAVGLTGQQRALDAIEFSARTGKPGFNLFVVGPNGMRAQCTVEQVVNEAAGEGLGSSDRIYVNNFADPRKLLAIPNAGWMRSRVPRSDAPAHRQSEDCDTCSARQQGLSNTACRH